MKVTPAYRNPGRRLNLMPTSRALGCVQCPPTRMLSASTMTAQRQERNGPSSGTAFRPGIAFIALLASLVGLGLAGLGLGALACLPNPVQAATTERLVVHRYTGF